MTVPNTPPGSDAEHPADAGSPPAPDDEPQAAPLPAGDGGQAGRVPVRLLPELGAGALTAVACVLLGVVMGLLWLWLAPRVMYVVHGDQILYVNPEGEERAGQDSVFALLGLAAGLLTALGVFLATRRRGGGVAVALGLAVGGAGGSLVAWWLGRRLGPTPNVLAHARQAGEGRPFGDALALGSHGALLVWPITAMIVLLGLTAAFGRREEDPPPYWASSPEAPAPAGQAHPDGTAEQARPAGPADHGAPDGPSRDDARDGDAPGA